MTHGDYKRKGRHGDEGLKIGREGLDPIFNFIESMENKNHFDYIICGGGASVTTLLKNYLTSIHHLPPIKVLPNTGPCVNGWIRPLVI